MKWKKQLLAELPSIFSDKKVRTEKEDLCVFQLINIGREGFCLFNNTAMWENALELKEELSRGEYSTSPKSC